MGDDCREARRHDKELDCMHYTLGYDRVPKERSDTELKEDSLCSFQVEVRDREDGDIRIIELRGVFTGGQVVTSAKGTKPSEVGCGCVDCGRAHYGYKGGEKVWRFLVDKSAAKALSPAEKKTVQGFAFHIECGDCMPRDYYFDPLPGPILSVDEYLNPKRGRDKDDGQEQPKRAKMLSV